MIYKNFKSHFAGGWLIRALPIFVVCATLVAGSFIFEVGGRSIAQPIEQTKNRTMPNEEAGILPPRLMERAMLYSRLHHPGASIIFAPRAMERTANRFNPSFNAQVLIYDARNDWFLPGFEARFEHADPVSDTVVNDAYDYHCAMRKFLKEVFKRNSIDGMGMNAVGTVHFGVRYVNAFWNGEQMVYGDGDGDLISSFVLVDVVGHELFHGVTQNTSKLDYDGQAGALNEHLSDVFGVLLRQWRSKLRVNKDSWLVGPGLFTSKVNGRALRDMRYPGTAYNDPFLGKDDQPAHMKDFVHTDEDNGGVHSNSGIPNRAFALFAISVGGKAWKTAGHIWFEVATGGHIPSNCDFQTFANQTVAVCAKQAPKEVAKLKAAWAAVGIQVD